jgi:XisI protein
MEPQTLTSDQQAILNVLEPTKDSKISYGNIERELIIDLERNQFQVMLIGWKGTTRYHSVLVHIAIRGSLIWLEEDNTELEIANRLVEHGIPKDRIVLGFHAPYKRAYSGFATGE